MIDRNIYKEALTNLNALVQYTQENTKDQLSQYITRLQQAIEMDYNKKK